jgi:hypothetical protein
VSHQLINDPLFIGGYVVCTSFHLFVLPACMLLYQDRSSDNNIKNTYIYLVRLMCRSVLSSVMVLHPNLLESQI